MKLVSKLTGLLALLCAGGAAALMLLSGSVPETGNLAARILLGAAAVGFLACALLRPRAKETAGSRVRGAVTAEDTAGCSFASVAANEGARRSLEQLCDYLRVPEKYTRLGARMPRGVLLYGPPGTGKTLLARALAGEAGVSFFALSGSDFVEKYVGVGAGRVRELFQRARKAGKCVIFIDEIDAMGRRRDDNSSDERDQTLNALLSEMSGFRAGEGVIVVAATNRIDALDPALLRPGRFDRQIEVGLPGRRERRSILELHSRNKPMSGAIDLDALAAETVRFSGASIEALLNEAAISAAQREAEVIEPCDVRAAYLMQVAGSDREASGERAELKLIALHEAGHALMTRLRQPGHRLTRVSILPAGRGVAGYSLSIPPEQTLVSRENLENQIRVLLAGRAAELLIAGETGYSTGASGDLKRAAELAGAMVAELGMADEPAVNLNAVRAVCGGGNDAAEKCRALLNRLFADATQILADETNRLMKLTEALLNREALDGDEVDAILQLSNESADLTA